MCVSGEPRGEIPADQRCDQALRQLLHHAPQGHRALLAWLPASPGPPAPPGPACGSQTARPRRCGAAAGLRRSEDPGVAVPKVRHRRGH
ncbi:hypothetical protein VULLAG_LOCUS18253 [Vulpes lagopus]